MQRKKSKKVRVKVALIILVSLIVGYKVSAKVDAKVDVKYELVTVYSGDSLWSIAKENIKNGEDIRKYVYDLRQINNLKDASIYPGQLLKIPVDK